jgi:flagellin
MRINNNLMAMNTHRMLGVNNVNSSKSVEKLSSGFRVNKAGDDAAGLAISEKMRGQIRGLNQSSRNAQDGISLLQTAEGSLNESHAILQRMRQLAVQSANDTNVDEDRKQLNNEITQLKSELNRIANTTEFNTQKLLNYGAELQVDGFTGISQGVINTLNEKIPGWINDSLLALSDHYGIDLPDNPTLRDMEVVYVQNEDYGAQMSTSDGGASLKLSINLDTFVDSNGNINPDDSLDRLIGHEIMHALQYTEMPDLLSGGLSDDERWFMEGLSMLIQGGNDFVRDGLASGDASAAVINGHDFNDGTASSTTDYASAYAAAKALHEMTDGGIAAIIDELEAGNSLDTAIANTTQQTQGEITVGADYNSWATFAAAFDANTFDAYLDGSPGTNDFDPNYSGTVIEGEDPSDNTLTSYADTIINNTGTATAYSHYNLSFSTGTAADASETPEQIVFHIGANEGQNMIFRTTDVTSNGLGLDSVSVSTQSQADKAITTINDAIITVSDKRSEIGALQNRLEHTIKNLDVSSENLQASESRIKDVDMAKEMMNFTKNNILSQAAQSMLAQANQAPQGVLALLR